MRFATTDVLSYIHTYFYISIKDIFILIIYFYMPALTLFLRQGMWLPASCRPSIAVEKVRGLLGALGVGKQMVMVGYSAMSSSYTLKLESFERN